MLLNLTSLHYLKNLSLKVNKYNYKNKNYYQETINKISNDYNIYSKLCYGEEFWIDIGHREIWLEILQYLEQWKKEIPDMPSINFDEEPQKSFEEIKDLSVAVYRKLFNNRDICKEILPIVFPNNTTLILLKEYFEKLGNNESIYKHLAEKIKSILNM